MVCVRVVSGGAGGGGKGWLVDEPLTIPDPSAVKPEEWDDEEDGIWMAEEIENPKCTVGCGPWTPPKIKNPKYVGKWTPKQVPNPNYIGEWKPRRIKNPGHYVVSCLPTTSIPSTLSYAFLFPSSFQYFDAASELFG